MIVPMSYQLNFEKIYCTIKRSLNNLLDLEKNDCKARKPIELP